MALGWAELAIGTQCDPAALPSATSAGPSAVVRTAQLATPWESRLNLLRAVSQDPPGDLSGQSHPWHPQLEP